MIYTEFSEIMEVISYTSRGKKKKVNPVQQNSNGADVSFQPRKISTVNGSTVMKF